MKNKSISAAFCAMFCAFIIAGAFLKIPLVILSITLQLEFVLFAALLLGASRAAASVGAYIIMGICGLPVFTQGGGLMYVLKPSFGFIIGFLFGSMATGFVYQKLLLRKTKSGIRSCYIACLAGIAVIYLCGTVYFYIITRFYLNTYSGFMAMMSACVLTTLPIDLVLCVPVSAAAACLRPAIKRYLTSRI